MPRKLRKKFTTAERRESEQRRHDVFEFMRRFNAKCLWEIDGPENTDCDWIMCFAYEGGIALIQTWCRGGWDIYTPPTVLANLDATETAMRNQIAAAKNPALVERRLAVEGMTPTGFPEPGPAAGDLPDTIDPNASETETDT